MSTLTEITFLISATRTRVSYARSRNAVVAFGFWLAQSLLDFVRHTRNRMELMNRKPELSAQPHSEEPSPRKGPHALSCEWAFGAEKLAEIYACLWCAKGSSCR
jgi:hypothetical protein